MLKAFILDDEPKAQLVLKKLLNQHCPSVEVVGIAETVDDALEKITNAPQVDLLFMDINLGKENCFRLLDALAVDQFGIIFTTGYDKFAIKAFEYNAIHYLLKPVDPAELKEAVLRFNNFRSPSFKKINSVFTSRIAVPTNLGYELLAMDEIIRCEGQRSYTLVITKEHKKLVSKPLGYFEEKLDTANFIRVHKRHIVNLKQVMGYTREKAPSITMSNGDSITVSLRNRAVFFKALEQDATL